MTHTIKLRAQQIQIDLPVEGAYVWVRAILQRVVKNEDYQTIQTVDRVEQVNRMAENFQMEIRSFTDPVTGQQVTLSGAGLAMSVSEFCKGWMLQDIPNTALNDQGDVIIKE